MIPNIDFSGLRAARSEGAFWSAFEQASDQALAYPHGLLSLWTPAARIAVFRDKGVHRHLVALDEVKGAREAYTARNLGPAALGDIRRSVRRGQWVISFRDPALRWHVMDDARSRRIAFQDPMAPDRDLGLAT